MELPPVHPHRIDAATIAALRDNLAAFSEAIESFAESSTPQTQTSSTTTYQGVQESIEQVDAMLEQVSRLRRSRNDLVPINKVPDDVLRNVFRYAGPALDFSLGSNARSETPTRVYNAIIRARGMPLNVTVLLDQFKKIGCEEALAPLVAHQASIRRLSLRFDSQWEGPGRLWMDADYALLEELRLHYAPLSGETFLQMLKGQHPHLRLVELVPDSGRGSAREDTTLLEALSGSPDLEELTLHNPYMSAAEVVARPDDRPGCLSLPHLRSLRFDMAVEKASAILTRIATSDTELRVVEVVLHSWNTGSSKESGRGNTIEDASHLDATLLSLPSETCLPMLTRIRSLSLSYACSIDGGFDPAFCYNHPVRPHAPASSKETNDAWCSDTELDWEGLRMRFNSDEADRARGGLMARAFDNFLGSAFRYGAFDGVRTLRLELDDSLHRPGWPLGRIESVLRGTPDVHTLVLASGVDGIYRDPQSTSCSAAVRILGQIASSGDSEGDGDSHSALVPHLECVTLVGCFFVRWPGLDEVANVLGELVRVRRGLRFLVLERCTSAGVSGDEIVQALQRDGLEVRWTPEEQGDQRRLASMVARRIVGLLWARVAP
ncbi:hypothetical protein LXA43DRAFT_1182549 [Ganoderma leucocontextum]|nr:hypothetical protein LXA43DRAFT_1182549 [Ganoderma leucocontextum]